MQVWKFGGASVKDARNIKNVASILAKNKEHKVVVISAMGKMTNAFEALIDAYFNNEEQKWEQFEAIKAFHNTIIGDLFEEDDTISKQIGLFLDSIQKRLERKPSIDYDFEYDQLIGYGELLSTRIVSAYLEKAGTINKWTDIRFSLKTDENWREANVNWEYSTELIQKEFNFNETSLFITQGFIGSTISDLTTSLGREGSDYTAAILGNILGAERVEVYKDVSGILNADPQYFKNPKRIDKMSYHEAVELTFFGAKVIHPKTIKPLKNSNIPLHVRSFLKPEGVGTIIGPESSEMQNMRHPVFILKTKQVLITLAQPDFSFMDERSVSWIFETFAEMGVKINLMQHSALNLSISIDLPERGILNLIETLSEQFEVRYNDGLELLTIRYYTPEAIEGELANRNVYVEQKSRLIARYLVKAKKRG